jgi:hypothetical protein
MSRIPKLVFAVLVASSAMVASAAVAQELSKLEFTCGLKLGKAASKLASTAIRETMRCRDDDISGATVGACPNAANLTEIAAASALLEEAVDTNCGSVCAISQTIRCVADDLCPALPTTGSAEFCTAGATNEPFDMENLGFPGAFCEEELGGPILSVAGIYGCVDPLTSEAAAAIVDSVYGSIDNAAALTSDQAKCVAAIGKGAAKLSQTIYKGVAKCRSLIAKGKVKRNPRTCAHDDPKVAAKIAKIEAKVAKLIEARCTDADIPALDLCDAGVGGILDRAQATECIIDTVTDLTDTPQALTLRSVPQPSLIEAAYPPEPSCGDGVVNQIPNPFLLVGEECDGADDALCPGACNPPGDVFECTCSTARRSRFVANGFTADLDSGWNGSSHDSGVTDGAGFVTELSNCDCDVMAGAACTGTSVDSICNSAGNQMPTCSWDVFSATRCDDHGNNNNRDEHSDCFVCDSFSSNPNTSCDSDGDCDPQCIDSTGAAIGPCPGGQGDCASGEVCRGRCDRSQSCVFVHLGAPLPLSAGGTPTCVVNVYREDIFGTRNIVTGEQDTFSQHYSLVHLGIKTSVPCPVCGGFCDGGGPLDGDVCKGSCSDDQAECRFDDDCNPGATCTPETSDCPNGFCNLSLVCRGGPADAQPCRVGASTPLFGTTSLDCPPTPAQNISGNGLEVPFYPATTEPLSLAFTVPCTAPGYELFDCACPDDGGRKTQPNECAAACDAGAELGDGCANGNSSGQLTTCVGGPNAAKACDEDSDCTPGTCSGNPTHCTGDPAFERFGCTTNADCGLGNCVDACPSGRCLPLCVPDGVDPEDGVCAAGPTAYHCDGAQDSFRTCTETEAAGGCGATCSVAATPCASASECPVGETCQGSCELAKLCEAGPDGVLGNFDDQPGAGICVGDNRNCFLDPITGEGGDTINGEGDPVNVKSVSIYCLGATNSSAINTAAGLGGPGRLRQRGVNLTSGFTSLP